MRIVMDYSQDVGGMKMIRKTGSVILVYGILTSICIAMTSCYRTCTFNYMHWVHENSDSVNVVRDTVLTGTPHVIIRDTVLGAIISIKNLEVDK